MLKIQSLSKAYSKKSILKNVSFQIQQGEIIGLVGENGAGKSTLLHILATILKPSSGTITFNEQVYSRKSLGKFRKQIGFVPQEVAIWDQFTVEENMLFFEKLSWKKKSKEQLRQLCLDVKLDKWKESVHTLSGGMKRKLNLAISLIHEPSLLLLDEPTVGIDLKSKQEIASYLKKLAKEKGLTIVYISHDMDEIINLCDRIFSLGEDPFYYEFLTKLDKEVIPL
ncbi:ABC transporter ATP-binding protein [Ornithinibacillus sp. 4-3]|uniref:ABC transporter ATP-binding protein n=1 Tax=Ornithinibacillus sp. 4-3 TaxID=3231488 RepID=A0AB39HRM4_9BACI